MLRFLICLTSTRIYGRKNIPASGPLLVVSNHLSMADPPLLGMILGKKARFMAKKELFRYPLFKYILPSFGAFAVHRNQLDRNALRQAGAALKNGKALVIFPEGKRSLTGGLQTAYPGTALIAHRNNVPVLPVGIYGSEKVRGWKWIFLRPKITIVIGEPFHLPEHRGKMTQELLRQSVDDIMLHIAALLPERYQGVYHEKRETGESQ